MTPISKLHIGEASGFLALLIPGVEQLVVFITSITHTPNLVSLHLWAIKTESLHLYNVKHWLGQFIAKE